MENKNADPILTGFLCQSPQRKLEREKGEEVKEGKKEGTIFFSHSTEMVIPGDLNSPLWSAASSKYSETLCIHY